MTDDESIGLLKIITQYAYALDILDQYDYQSLEIKNTSGKEVYQLAYEEAVATLQWQETRKGMSAEVMHFEEKGFADAEVLEAKIKALVKEGKTAEAKELLNKFTRDFTGASMLRWKELENDYWGQFGTGF